VGHSDGDVLVHAICDARLARLRWVTSAHTFRIPIGNGKVRQSLAFLVHIRELLADKNLQIVYIDGIVIAERPKLGLTFPVCEWPSPVRWHWTDRINLKAKTNEGMDAIGRGEAIAAHAIATLQG